MSRSQAHRRLYPNRGSHLPVLIKLVSMTDGPILELGCGLYSTTFLHWACRGKKRKLVTYEHNPDFYDFAKEYENEYHEVHCIDDWDSIEISKPWSIAFVDHEPGLRRWQEVSRLVHADYVVCHDTNNAFNRKYGYFKIYGLFEYRWKYTGATPHTTIFSNKNDVRNFKL